MRVLKSRGRGKQRVGLGGHTTALPLIQPLSMTTPGHLSSPPSLPRHSPTILSKSRPQRPAQDTFQSNPEKTEDPVTSRLTSGSSYFLATSTILTLSAGSYKPGRACATFWRVCMVWRDVGWLGVEWSGSQSAVGGGAEAQMVRY